VKSDYCSKRRSLTRLFRREFLSKGAAGYRDDPSAQRDLEAGITAVRDHARDLVGQDAKELVDRFGQMGRRKLMMAG
jgi:hypothetical protein